MSNIPILKTTITCPECGFRKEEQMDSNYCRFFWECSSCSILFKPKKRKCCVYCSYGDQPCPPVQLQ